MKKYFTSTNFHCTANICINIYVNWVPPTYLPKNEKKNHLSKRFVTDIKVTETGTDILHKRNKQKNTFTFNFCKSFFFALHILPWNSIPCCIYLKSSCFVFILRTYKYAYKCSTCCYILHIHKHMCFIFTHDRCNFRLSTIFFLFFKLLTRILVHIPTKIHHIARWK